MAKTLSKDRIVQALEALANEIPTTGDPMDLVVMGGAALVLLYDARDSTRDVDIVAGGKEVRDAAAKVAVALDLPPDWLNDGAKGYVHGLALGPILLQTPSLVVRSLAPRQLLAMKLCAWRDDVDISDARLLLSKTAGERDAVWRSVEPHLVPGRELKARYAFDDLWEAAHGTP